MTKVFLISSDTLSQSFQNSLPPSDSPHPKPTTRDLIPEKFKQEDSKNFTENITVPQADCYLKNCLSKIHLSSKH